MKFSFGDRQSNKHSNICTSRAASSQLKTPCSSTNSFVKLMSRSNPGPILDLEGEFEGDLVRDLEGDFEGDL